jgi:hypothetical protein
MKYLKEEMEGVASFPVLNINNADIMSFSYYFKDKNCEHNKKKWMFQEADFRQYIKLKKDNKVYHVKTIKNDISNFPSQVYISSSFYSPNHEVWYEDYLIDIILPHKYFLNSEVEKIFVEGLGEITEDDDPIVVMMKLKNTNK